MHRDVAVLPALVAPAWADHGASRPAAGLGFGLEWLLIGGLLVVLGLAAWAFLAPERDDPSEPPRSDRSHAE